MWTQQPAEKKRKYAFIGRRQSVAGRRSCCVQPMQSQMLFSCSHNHSQSSLLLSGCAVLFLAISVVSPLLKTVNRDCFQIPVVHDTQRLASTWRREWDGRRSFAYCGLCLLHCLCALFAFFFITLEQRERQFICVVEKERKIFLTFARASSSRYGDFNV